eukprot:Clim_evm6s222 gene=Clim_evmTU6s222
MESGSQALSGLVGSQVEVCWRGLTSLSPGPLHRPLLVHCEGWYRAELLSYDQNAKKGLVKYLDYPTWQPNPDIISAELIRKEPQRIKMLQAKDPVRPGDLVQIQGHTTNDWLVARLATLSDNDAVLIFVGQDGENVLCKLDRDRVHIEPRRLKIPSPSEDDDEVPDLVEDTAPSTAAAGSSHSVLVLQQAESQECLVAGPYNLFDEATGITYYIHANVWYAARIVDKDILSAADGAVPETDSSGAVTVFFIDYPGSSRNPDRLARDRIRHVVPRRRVTEMDLKGREKIRIQVAGRPDDQYLSRSQDGIDWIEGLLVEMHDIGLATLEFLGTRGTPIRVQWPLVDVFVEDLDHTDDAVNEEHSCEPSISHISPAAATVEWMSMRAEWTTLLADDDTVTVQYNDESKPCSVDMGMCIITGLTPETCYNVSIRAGKHRILWQKSMTTSKVRAPSKPPQVVCVARGVRFMTLQWNCNTDVDGLCNGAPIEGFTIAYFASEGDAADPGSAQTVRVNGDVRACDIQNLFSDHGYTITVQTRTSAGLSPAATISARTRTDEISEHAVANANDHSTVLEDQGMNNCNVCLTRSRDAVLVPCGHRLCFSCAMKCYNAKKQVCPFDRQPLREVVKTYDL